MSAEPFGLPMVGRPRPHPSPVLDTWLLAGRALKVTRRTPTALVSSAFLPVMLLLLMTATFARVFYPDTSYGAYADRVLPLFGVTSLLFASLATATSVYHDLHSGLDARLRALPIARGAPLVARVMGDGVRGAAQLLVLLAVGYLIGFRFRTGLVGAAAFVVLPVLFGSAVTWAAVFLATRAKVLESVAAALNGSVLLLMFLSTGLVAQEDFPAWAQGLVGANPVSQVVEAMRALSQGGSTAGPVLVALTWTFLLTAVFGVLAVRSYSRAGTRS